MDTRNNKNGNNSRNTYMDMLWVNSGYYYKKHNTTRDNVTGMCDFYDYRTCGSYCVFNSVTF